MTIIYCHFNVIHSEISSVVLGIALFVKIILPKKKKDVISLKNLSQQKKLYNKETFKIFIYNLISA